MSIMMKRFKVFAFNVNSRPYIAAGSEDCLGPKVRDLGRTLLPSIGVCVVRLRPPQRSKARCVR